MTRVSTRKYTPLEQAILSAVAVHLADPAAPLNAVFQPPVSLEATEAG
jgi:hypothetical protein